MRRTTVAVALAAVTFAAGLGACSDDESASDQVCEDRADLGEQMDDVADELAAGNLGEAREEMGDVEDDLGDLQSSLEDLSAEQRQELAPEVDELESQVADLGEAESLDDLSAGADEAVTSVESILGQISDSLSC